MLDSDEAANAWLERVAAGAVKAAWPSLLYAEVAHTLLRSQRAERITRAVARGVLRSVLLIPTYSVRLEVVVEAAWALAPDRGVSAYDACYVVLAETLAAPLVTADRHLAAATSNAVLISA